MLRAGLTEPRRVLMTVDAVGGVWRYAIDLARKLAAARVAVIFVGLGPAPSADQRAEAGSIPGARVIWLDEPLDWLARSENDLAGIAPKIAELARAYEVDLLHLNVPSQACGLEVGVPVVVVSHSCVVTWWQAVRGIPFPPSWMWLQRANRRGLERADVVLAPSSGHADALESAYGSIAGLRVCHNGSTDTGITRNKEPWVFAAGRWWDEGKNGVTLDRAAASAAWPVCAAGPLSGPNGESIAFAKVEALGEQSATAVRALMARASIFVAPSLYEPFGLAVLEAAQASAALVLADIPVFRELWGDVAVFADPKTPQAFADAINVLAHAPERRVALASAAQHRAKRYTPDRQVSSILASYRDALARYPSLCAM